MRLNNTEEYLIQNGKKNLVQVLNNLTNLYHFGPNILYCSEFMHTTAYTSIFEALSKKIMQDSSLYQKTLETVPESKRHITSAHTYPIHEFACVQYLANLDYALKIGPSKEKIYDKIMQDLSFPLNFAYLKDALALGTGKIDYPVVHYIPSSHGPSSGQRIFFADTDQKIIIKLKQGNAQALRYFCHLASQSAIALGKNPPSYETTSKHKLPKIAAELLFEYVIKPYKEAAK